MFSSSIVRRGPSSFVKPRCNSIGLGQLSTTAAASAAAAAGTRGACRRQVSAFRAAAIGQPKETSDSTATSAAGYGSRLMLEKEAVFTVAHRHVSRSRSSALQQQQVRTFGGGAIALVHAQGLKGGGKQSVRPTIGASTKRWFVTAGDEPADTDTDSYSSESESEFESTIFGAAPQTAESAAGDEPPAKKKTSKARKFRKRRTGNSEGTPSTEPAAEAAAEATTATKKPRARNPRKRRTITNGDSTPSSPAEPAGGASTATGEERGEEEAESDADIPRSRKAAFERARRAGVAQRAREDGVPLDRNDSDSPSSGEEEQHSDNDDHDHSSPSSWQEPATPVRPEGFPFSAEGSVNAAKRRTQQRKRVQQEQHPVLGHFVADLKYKKVYVTSIDALMKAPVWEKAQTFRPVHAAEIFHAQKLEADKLEIQMIEAGKIEAQGDMEKKAKGLPGVITLFKRPLQSVKPARKQQKYTLGILDGQHRLGAMLLLAEAGLWDRSEQNVVVEVFDTKDDREIGQLFLDINKAEPIELDLGQPRSEDAQKCADKVVLHLYNEFRPMFGSKRARQPSLHAITFKENLVRSGMIERHDLYDPDLLLDYLLRVNEMLSEREMHMWELMIGQEGAYSTKKALLTALRKARRHGFWLGMELSWMLV